MTHDHYVLYGVEASYYAAKLRCYLLQKPLAFTEVSTDRTVFAEVIIPRVGYPIVPVLVTPQGETLQDTAEIIERLESRHPQTPLVPLTPVRRLANSLLEFYADEWLKLPALYYRWHYDYEFAHTMMGVNNDPSASVEEQRRVGAKIAAGFKDWPQHLGAQAATYAAVEAAFLEFLQLAENHFATHRYVLGGEPSVSDCALMGPLYAHLFRDPHSGAIVRARAPAVCRWIARMRAARSQDAVDESGGDELPDTLFALLRCLSRDFVPVLSTAIPLLQAWLGSHRGEAIPRYVGKHRYTLGAGTPYEAQGMRSIHSFEQWKLQRVLAVFNASPAAQRRELNAFLERAGAADLLNLGLPNRLARKDFRLVHAQD